MKYKCNYKKYPKTNEALSKNMGLSLLQPQEIQLYIGFGDEEMEVSEILCPDNPW